MRWRVVPNYNSYIVSDSGIIVSNKTQLSHWLGFNDNYISCKLRRKQNIINNKFKIERVEV